MAKREREKVEEREREVMKTLRKLLSSGRCIALLNQNGKQGRIIYSTLLIEYQSVLTTPGKKADCLRASACRI
jgi:hypothetical protein